MPTAAQNAMGFLAPADAVFSSDAASIFIPSPSKCSTPRLTQPMALAETQPNRLDFKRYTKRRFPPKLFQRKELHGPSYIFRLLHAATAITTGTSSNSHLSPNPTLQRLTPMALGLLISPYGDAEGNHQARPRHGLQQLLPLTRRVHQQVHGRMPQSRLGTLLAKYQPGCHHRRSGRSAAAGVELPAGSIDHRPCSAQDACGAHRCAAAGFGLCEAARHQAGSDALRIHSGGSGGRALSGQRSRPSARSRSTATATASTS